jgi:hypothetical protein
MSADAVATLHYAGDIKGRARFDMVDPSTTVFALTPHQVTIRDIRPERDRFGLDDAGFAFLQHNSHHARDSKLFETLKADPRSRDAIVLGYEREVADFLTACTGAREVWPQIGGLVVRASRRAERQTWAQTADFVHLDFTPDTAARFMAWTFDKPPAHRRFAVYQCWRALTRGPQDNTLAICDGRSAQGGDAIICDSRIGPEDEPGNAFEFRLCRHAPGHAWYYLPGMDLDDLLVFKGFDSDDPHAMNAMHAAFDNPLAGPDAEPRRSIEARFLAFFD